VKQERKEEQKGTKRRRNRIFPAVNTLVRPLALGTRLSARICLLFTCHDGVSMRPFDPVLDVVLPPTAAPWSQLEGGGWEIPSACVCVPTGKGGPEPKFNPVC
jgi:hypothetical protein